MLKQLRHKKTAKKIWIGLALIIVPAFVFWGFGGAFRSRSENPYAGVINGRKIPLDEFKDSMLAVRSLALMQFGENFNEVQGYLDLPSQAWQRLILLEEAKRRSIKASDREVIALIEKYPFFMRNGQFDNQLYNQSLQYNLRTQPRVFEEETRQNIILAKLYEQVTAPVKLSDDELKEAYIKANQEISIYYIAGLIDEFKKQITPSQQQVKEYFNKNPQKFKQPLSFNMEYIVVDSEEKLKDVYPYLNKRGGLEKAAESLKLKPRETGLFKLNDPIPGVGWAPLVSAKIARLKPQEMLEPLRVDNKYYLMILKERKEPFIPEFEAIRDQAGSSLASEKALTAAKEKTQGCLDKMRRDYADNPSAADFSKSASDCGLKYGATAPFKFGSYIEGIGASDDFWLAAQKLKSNDFSGTIETPAGFFIIRTKSITTPEESKFAAEKEELRQKLLLQKQQESFTEFIQGLEKKSSLY